MHMLVRCRSFAALRSLALSALFLAPLPMACAGTKPVSPSASADVAAAPAARERIPLGFDWPSGFAARVRGTEARRLLSGTVRDETQTELAYRIRIEPGADGLRVRYDDFSLPDPHQSGLVRLAAVPGLETLSAALQPSFVVSPDGRLAGTPDLDGVAQSINQELARLHAQPGGLPEGAPLLPTRFSPEVFRRHVPDEWVPMVELWAGREVELGTHYEVDLVVRLPLLDGRPVRMDGELLVSERIPCGEHASEARCVELVLVSRSAPSAPAGLDDIQSPPDVQASSSRPELTALQLDETIRLVTEPETLVPYRVSTTRRARVSVRLPDGSLHTDALDHELDLVFHPET